MFRRLAWIGKLLAAGLIISFLSIWTTGYIVTSYVESLLRQFELPIEVPPMAMSGVWGSLWGSDPFLVSEDGGQEDQPSDKEAVDEKPEPDAEEVFAPIEEEPITDNGGSQEDGGGEETDGTETSVTPDELEAAKDEMSQADKELLFDLLMSKLPEEAWLEISEYMEEGLTEQELISVEQVMAQHLDTAEYEQMMEILKKY